MKKSEIRLLPYYLILFFAISPFIRSYAQTAPVCAESELPGSFDPADEYYKAIQRACTGMNAGFYDSVRYYLEKAIFFKDYEPMPKEKRQQLFNFLGKDKFIQLPCFCENPSDISTISDSSITPADTMPEQDPSSIVLDSATKKNMEDKAIIKCNQFVGYIKTVTGEKSNRDEISNAIESAVALFVNEDCTIEVSSRNRGETKKITVRKYFQKLTALHQYYDKINIIGSRYYIISGLRKAPDGNYYTVVSFEQIFTGYQNEQIAYTDMTRKNIIVMVLQLKKIQEGGIKNVWDVLLKEVQVVETI